jgi:hypothetical protein
LCSGMNPPGDLAAGGNLFGRTTVGACAEADRGPPSQRLIFFPERLHASHPSTSYIGIFMAVGGTSLFMRR